MMPHYLHHSSLKQQPDQRSYQPQPGLNLLPLEKILKGYTNICFPFLLLASLPSSRQADRYHSIVCACSNKKETGIARPLLISLAEILIGKFI